MKRAAISGFTLIEAAITMAVLAIILAVAVPSFHEYDTMPASSLEERPSKVHVWAVQE